MREHFLSPASPGNLDSIETHEVREILWCEGPLPIGFGLTQHQWLPVPWSRRRGPSADYRA